MSRFFRCKFVISKKEKKSIPIWELDVYDEKNEELIYEKSFETFYQSDLVDGYFDLVDKKVVTGKLIEIFETSEDNNSYKVGDKVLVEVGFNEMTIKEISNIKIDLDRFTTIFTRSKKEEENILKNKKDYKVTTIYSNNSDPVATEIRYYCNNIYEFTDGTVETYKHKLKKLV